MPARVVKVLVLDPDADQRQAIAERLTARGLSVEAPERHEKATERLSKNVYGVVIVNLDRLGERWGGSDYRSSSSRRRRPKSL